jgi:hypothetical protein
MQVIRLKITMIWQKKCENYILEIFLSLSEVNDSEKKSRGSENLVLKNFIFWSDKLFLHILTL